MCVCVCIYIYIFPLESGQEPKTTEKRRGIVRKDTGACLALAQGVAQFFNAPKRKIVSKKEQDEEVCNLYSVLATMK